MLASFTSAITGSNRRTNTRRSRNTTTTNNNNNYTTSSSTTYYNTKQANTKSIKKHNKKKNGKTLYLADYLTAFCDSGATSFLLSSRQVKRLQKSVGSHSYKLTGPHRLWFVVSVEEGLLRWSSQAYSEREESRVPSSGSLIVEQPNSMSIRLENIVEIKKGSPNALVLPPSPRGKRSPKGSNGRYGDPWNSKNSQKNIDDMDLLPQHLFTIRSRDDKYMILQAPNARKLNTWIDTLRQYIFEFGSPLGLGRDLSNGFMEVNNHYNNNNNNINSYHPSSNNNNQSSSLRSNNNNQVMVLGRGKMSARKNRRRFFDYIQQNNLDAILQMLHNNSNELLNVTDSNSNNAVIIAARSGHASVLRALLEYGGNVNVKNKEGISPLLMATKAGNLECVETLLQVNEIVSNTTQHDIELLNDKGKSLLHFAVSHNQVEIVAMLCEFAIDLIDWTDKSGNTPLHIAAKYGRYECVKILLETAADPNILNRKGKTPLTLARSRSQRHCVTLLKEYGGSSRGHMPNENNGQKKEMDMDRIMQIWGAFLENAAKAFLTNDDLQIQQRTTKTITNSAYNSNDRWATSSSTTPEISVMKEDKYGSTSSSSRGSSSSSSRRKNDSYYKKSSSSQQIYNNTSHRKVEKKWDRATNEKKSKKDAIKVWEIMTDANTGESYYWCPTTNETKWTLEAGDFDMGYDYTNNNNNNNNNSTTTTRRSASINNFMSPRSSSNNNNNNYNNNDNNNKDDEWSLNFDEVSQKYYWWNKITSESRWDESSNASDVITATIINDESTPYNTNDTSTTTLINNEDVWTYHLDETSQRYYWWNSKTGESSWADNNNNDNNNNSTLLANNAIDNINYDATAVVLIEEEWLECYDENGYLYYYNNLTGESQWPNTESFGNTTSGNNNNNTDLSSSSSTNTLTALVIADGEASEDNTWAYYTDETSGRAYWFNSVTNESVWAD